MYFIIQPCSHLCIAVLYYPDLSCVSVECDPACDGMTDSGVDSEVSPSSPDSESGGRPAAPGQQPVTHPVTHSAEELVAKMEVDEEEGEEDKFVISDCDPIAEKMETVEALLSLSDSSRSPGGSPEKPLITILPAHSLKGELSRI